MDNPKVVLNPAQSLSIDQFADGRLCSLGNLEFFQGHIFSYIAFADSIVVKLPTYGGMQLFAECVKYDRPRRDRIRANEILEEFSNLDAALDAFPAFKSTLAQCGPDITHYLIVNKLQYERLKNSGVIHVPTSRFVVAVHRLPDSSEQSTPAIVQERISGVTLWEMFDFVARDVRDRWKPHMRAIARQLEPLTNSELLAHMNWNIQNLVFQPDTELLYYVDMKPSTLFRKSFNDRNLDGIRTEFLNQRPC
jgi:hypothetical protein